MEKVLKIVNLKDSNNDYHYWKYKTDIEKLTAIEILRLQYINFNKNVQPRLQRVCTIINKA